MKSANKLVSVIIPTYNCEKYIEECIKSICMQTYKELEIIVVDDKSTDSTVKIIESIMDDRICLIQKKSRGGQCESRNIALEKAKGRYIAFVDGDDSLALNFIEKLLFVITSSDADIAFCDFNIIGKGNEHEYSDVIYEDKESIIDAFISGQLTNRIMNKLYVRDSLGRVTFPNGRNIKEDAYWSSKVLMNATKVIGIPDALYNYRVYSGSSSQRKLSDIEIIGMYTNDLEKYNCFLNNTTSDIQKEAIIGLSEPIIRWLLIYAKDLTMFNVYKSIFTWCDLTGLEQYSLRDNTYKEVNELGKRIIREEFHRLTLKGKISLLRNKAKR